MTKIRQRVNEVLADEPALLFEPAGLDRAIVGVSCYQPRRPRCVVYDYTKVLEHFAREGMTMEEAEEWVSFNTLGAWLGDTTPIVLDRLR